MRRFNFQVKDSNDRRYLHRRFLRDLASAQIEAARYSVALQHSPDPVWAGQTWTMRIFDDADITFFTLTFPGTRPSCRRAQGGMPAR